MSKYTIELRKIKDEFYTAMQDYPIFDESYRQELNDKIYHACRYREIGFETVELFLDELQEFMELNMQEYNYLYKSNLIDLTPLQRVKIIELLSSSEGYNKKRTQDISQDTNFKRDENGNSDVNSNENSDSTRTDNLNTETLDTGTILVKNKDLNTTSNTNYNSDFPQGNLTDKTDSNYYTTGSKSDGTNNTDTENSTTNNLTTEKKDTGTVENKGNTQTDTKTNFYNNRNEEGNSKTKDSESVDYDRNYGHTKEKTGNADKTDFELISQYRKLFLNVDKKLIQAMKKELFMNIW